jgi:putative flippase GtrA
MARSDNGPTVDSGLKQQIFWFTVVGAIGFGVDAGILETAVHRFGSDPYAARALSFPAAASTTWFFNRWLTFRPPHKPSFGEWGLYLILMGLGALLNLGVYAITVRWWLGASPGALLLALAAGTGAGMTVNFLSARYLLNPSGQGPHPPSAEVAGSSTP